MNFPRRSKRTPDTCKYVCLVIFSILVSVSGQLRAATEASAAERISITYCSDCVPFHFQDAQGQPAGKIDGILGISRDMTEQQAAEAERKASMERFRVLFEQSSDAHLILVEDKVIECNNAAVEMLGCKDRQDLLARQPSTFSPELQLVVQCRQVYPGR